MLRMRIGARAVLKLTRLMQAMAMMSIPMTTSRAVVLRLPVFR